MRDVVVFLIGLYLLVVVIVFGGAVYGVMSGETAKHSPCPVPGNWLVWSGYRAALWPKTYFDDIAKTDDLMDWWLVRYTPLTASCADG
jgi:hypothetical protein